MPPKLINPDAAVVLASSYALGSVRSFEHLLGGTTQTNYLLKASEGDFVLRAYQNRSVEYVCFEIDVLNQLSAAGFACQQPIANVRGKFVDEEAGNPFVVFRYIVGEHASKQDQHAQVALLVARMHRLSPLIRSEYWSFRERYNRHSCLQTAELNVSKAFNRAEAHVILDWLRIELEHLELPEGLPTGLCHCDLNPSNFLYRSSRLVAILDFDMAAPTQILYDVASLLYWWANPVVDDRGWHGRAREVLAAYQEIRQLTDDERHHLYDMLKLVFLISVSWFIHIPAEIAMDRRGIIFLNALGRDAFQDLVFRGVH